MAFAGEQAGVELPLGRQARACAIAAEGLGDRGDHADFTAAVDIAPALGHFARVISLGRFERRLGADQFDDFSGGDHILHAPTVGVADIHVFNEAQNVATTAKMPRHGSHRLVIDAAFDHHIDFHRRKAHSGSGIDAGQHPGHREIDVIHFHEDRVVQGVEADGNAVKSGSL